MLHSLVLAGCEYGPFYPDESVPFRIPSVVVVPGEVRAVSSLLDRPEDWVLSVVDESVAGLVDGQLVARSPGASWLRVVNGSGTTRDSLPVFVITRDATRPNIVVVLTDDQDAQSLGLMPTVAGLLAADGVTFTRSYVTTPMCCPSRASLLTGQYPHNHAVLTNRKNDQGGWPAFVASGAEDRTIAVALEAAGYQTGLIGKYMNWYPNGGPGVVPPGWTTWRALHVTPTSYQDYVISFDGEDRRFGAGPDEYQTDVLGAEAVDFVRRSVIDGDPFFLLFAPYAPHDPAVPAPRHSGQLADRTLPTPASFNEADVSDKPSFIRSLPLLTRGEIDWMDDLYRLRGETLLAVDEALARLLDELSLLGERRETYVVFTSDNGFHMGEHRLSAGKNLLYEEDIRVPLVISGPGVASARIERSLVANVDLTHTIADWAGLGAWPGDGLSLRGLLGVGASSEWRSALLLENWYVTNELDFAHRGLHFGDSVFVDWSTDEMEFYDLEEDPLQLQNRAATRDVRHHRALLELLSGCSGASCVVR